MAGAKKATEVIDDCPDCPEASPLMTDGLCYWQGCEVKATDLIYTDGINRKIPKIPGVLLPDPEDEGKEQFVPTGNIELCYGHFQRWRRLGRLDLKWSVINAAFQRQIMTGGV